MPTIAPAFMKSGQESSRCRRSAKYLATARIRISFTHSEGWKWLPPGILIQRRAPRYFCPKIITAISDATAAM
jgi:hypothetical protein